MLSYPTDFPPPSPFSLGDFYYIIDDGKCEIFVASYGKVLDVKEGDAFGELALMYDAPRAATVIGKTKSHTHTFTFSLFHISFSLLYKKIAATDVITWALDQLTFKKTLKDTTIKKRNMLQDFLKEVPILRLLTDYERLTLADALNECHFDKHEVIIKEGDEGETFYIIEDGEVKCTKQGECVIRNCFIIIRLKITLY